MMRNVRNIALEINLSSPNSSSCLPFDAWGTFLFWYEQSGNCRCTFTSCYYKKQPHVHTFNSTCRRMVLLACRNVTNKPARTKTPELSKHMYTHTHTHTHTHNTHTQHTHTTHTHNTHTHTHTHTLYFHPALPVG